MTTPMSRRHIYLSDDLWQRIQQAALTEGARRGEAVSAAEWIRTACEERLERRKRCDEG